MAVRGAEGNHPLVSGPARQPVQRRPGLKADRHGLRAAQVNDLLQARPSCATRYQNPVDGPAGAEGLQHGMHADDDSQAVTMVTRPRRQPAVFGIMQEFLDSPNFHPSVYQVRRAGRLCGFLVIHSLFRGSSRGGMRMASDISEEEVCLLAEGMTLKFGLLGLPQGGAKAGIRANPDAPEQERYRALKEFGEEVAPLLGSRTYIPGPDMGTSNEMVRRMLTSLGVPVRHRELRGTRSGYFTALSVFSAARHAAEVTGLALAGAGVAIEGFGKVGSSLAELFAGVGARVVAVSTSRGALYRAQGLDVAGLVRASQQQGSGFVESFEGADRISLPELFSARADILCPCARHNTIHTAMAGSIQARIISPGSNHPFDLATEKVLVARGVVCVPYWVANCGGTLGETMEFSGWRDGEIAEFIHRRLEPHVRGVIRESQRSGLTPTEIAKPKTLQRFARMAAEAGQPGIKGRLMAAGLECYRRGLVPTDLVRVLSRRYYENEVLLPFESDGLTAAAAM